eukprot:6463836-Amphidinium_carterae.5
MKQKYDVKKRQETLKNYVEDNHRRPTMTTWTNPTEHKKLIRDLNGDVNKQMDHNMKVRHSSYINDTKLYINKSYQHDVYDLKHNQEHNKHNISQRVNKKEYDSQKHHHVEYQFRRMQRYHRNQ